jgi:CubicO group peptidase (beta-lactamase class C family)
LKSGALAPGTGAGIVVGVLQHGVRRVFPYGVANQDSIFEIGSITKTFTGLLLAQMVEQGQVRMDQPVRTLLPPGTVPKPAGDEITLLDLTTQHSGLPSNPDNLHPGDPGNPFADYSSTDLYAYLAARDVAHPAQTPYGYSNTGVKLLAQALSVRAGLPYSALLEQGIAGPLGMHDTGIALSPALSLRVVQGHDAHHHPDEAWTFSIPPPATCSPTSTPRSTPSASAQQDQRNRFQQPSR